MNICIVWEGNFNCLCPTVDRKIHLVVFVPEWIGERVTSLVLCPRVGRRVPFVVCALEWIGGRTTSVVCVP